MNIGTVLTLYVTDPQTKIDTKYRCKIIDKNEHYLFVDYPVNKNTKRTTLFTEGTYMKTFYIGGDQSVYSFNTKVIAKVNVTIPALAIIRPSKKDISRIQRRAYVRIKTAVDVSIHRAEGSPQSFATVTSDISGGGMSIILLNANSLDKRDILNSWMVLQMQNGEYHYIYSQSKVVRVITDKNNVHTASIKFETISKRDRQMVIQFCFEKQRESRTKELME